jgi:hypothetical protein
MMTRFIDWDGDGQIDPTDIATSIALDDDDKKEPSSPSKGGGGCGCLTLCMGSAVATIWIILAIV